MILYDSQGTPIPYERINQEPAESGEKRSPKRRVYFNGTCAECYFWSPIGIYVRSDETPTKDNAEDIPDMFTLGRCHSDSSLRMKMTKEFDGCTQYQRYDAKNYHPEDPPDGPEETQGCE